MVPRRRTVPRRLRILTTARDPTPRRRKQLDDRHHIAVTIWKPGSVHNRSALVGRRLRLGGHDGSSHHRKRDGARSNRPHCEKPQQAVRRRHPRCWSNSESRANADFESTSNCLDVTIGLLQVNYTPDSREG